MELFDRCLLALYLDGSFIRGWHFCNQQCYSLFALSRVCMCFHKFVQHKIILQTLLALQKRWHFNFNVVLIILNDAVPLWKYGSIVSLVSQKLVRCKDSFLYEKHALGFTNSLKWKSSGVSIFFLAKDVNKMDGCIKSGLLWPEWSVDCNWILSCPTNALCCRAIINRDKQIIQRGLIGALDQDSVVWFHTL